MKNLYLLVGLCLLFGRSHGQPLKVEVIKTDADPKDEKLQKTILPSRDLLISELKPNLQHLEFINGDAAQNQVSESEVDSDRYMFEVDPKATRDTTRSLGCAQRSSGLWQPFYGRSFLFLSVPVSWAQAQQRCLALGGNLATVHNELEEEFVKRVAEGQMAWIGFSDAQEEGYWFWINGDPLSYTNWCPGEPNNSRGNQSCAVINFSGTKCWDDDVCDKNFPFVCERKEGGI